ncbi:hypothetical protein JZ751_012417, partial [Albula glossodonta]
MQKLKKSSETTVEDITPVVCTNVGRKRRLASSVEEPDSKRQKEQPCGDKPSNVKGRRIKNVRKTRVGKVYEKGPKLGQGGFGSVFAGTRKSDGQSVALKYVCKDEEENIHLARVSSHHTFDFPLLQPGLEGPLPKEVGLIMKVNQPSSHPNILELYDWFDRPASYVMAMERPKPCQDLLDYCVAQGGLLKEEQARNVTKQLLGALQHCHDRGVVHRDVKPENILIQTDTKQIKLIDFGCGDPLQDDPYTEFSGTDQYLPPEWFLKQKFLAGPGTVWSVGVTLYNIVSGGFPFKIFTSRKMRHVEFREGLSPGEEAVGEGMGCIQTCHMCLHNHTLSVFLKQSSKTSFAAASPFGRKTGPLWSSCSTTPGCTRLAKSPSFYHTP